MQYRLRSLMIALGVAPPLLAGGFWLATRSDDFIQCIGALLIGAAGGLVIVPFLFAKREQLRALRPRVGRVPIAVPLSIYLFGLVLFPLLAWSAPVNRRYTFATFFGAMAIMQGVALATVIWYRVFPVTTTTNEKEDVDPPR